MARENQWARKAKIAAMWTGGAVVALAIFVAVVGGDAPQGERQERSPAVDDCANTHEREAWISSPSQEMGGYSPATHRMSATGRCATTLRVREDNCSPGHLFAAYGNKPFMQTAAKLGFRRISCGLEEYDLSLIRGQ